MEDVVLVLRAALVEVMMGVHVLRGWPTAVMTHGELLFRLFLVESGRTDRRRPYCTPLFFWCCTTTADSEGERRGSLDAAVCPHCQRIGPRLAPRAANTKGHGE